MPCQEYTIPAINMARSVKFYQTLGFIQTVATPNYAGFSCLSGETRFSLYHPKNNTFEKVKIGFETDGLEELVANLVAVGMQFVQLPTASPIFWQKAALYDPAGNLISFYRTMPAVNRQPFPLTTKTFFHPD